MAEVRDVLASIEQEIANVQPERAEQRLKSLTYDLGKDDLIHWRDEIERLAALLLKKRNRRVLAVIEERLIAFGIMAPQTELVAVPFREYDPGKDAQWLSAVFEELAQFHIFQWSTYYRDVIGRVVSRIADMTAQQQDVLLPSLIEVVSGHAEEIFEKGFQFKREEQGRPEASAHLTAITGLQRFCEVAIEHYSSTAVKSRTSAQRISLRRVVSSFVASALEGFTKVAFGSKNGAQLMAAHRTQWMHYLPFIRAPDLQRVVDCLGSGSVADIVCSYMLPIATAIDESHLLHNGQVWLPQISQYFHDQRKLEVLLHAPHAKEQAPQIEIFALLDSAEPPLSALREADSRNVSFIICSLRADVAASPTAERLQRRLINVLEGSIQDRQRRALDILKAAVIGSAGGRSGEERIEYNFARIFPLNNPFQARYFHVVRKSVRNLLREMEGRNGVRLWCSVRRSGKTTACFDLDALPGTEVLVQTCDNTHNDVGASALFEAIIDHLGTGNPIGKSFFRDAVEGLKANGMLGRRIILIIDEYETLFGRLRGAARYDNDVKYSVIFPLLSQMVAFCRENMIVFVGQQPNAHYIFMEQNPISAYVKQDSFPLFAHQNGSTGSEFVDLVEKVLTDSWSPTSPFIDAVFKETAGHPFLTVNVLVSLVDWLIAKGVMVKDVRFDLETWRAFIDSQLNSQKIAVNTEYQFFLEAAADAMSALGRETAPWLWAMYHSMRCFVEVHGAQGHCSVGEFLSLFNSSGLARSGISPEEILRTGADTNFFRVSDEIVAVCIPLLARISAAATPRVN